MFDTPGHEWFRQMLTDRCAHLRGAAVREIARSGATDLLPQVIELLRDDAPFVVTRRTTKYLIEVRFLALEAVESLYASLDRSPEIGPVAVCAAWTAERAMAAAQVTLASLTAEGLPQLLGEIQEQLDLRVAPRSADREAVEAYLILQRTGQIQYVFEEIDGTLGTTPTLHRIRCTQLAGERPFPQVRVFSPQNHLRLLGYIYRSDEGRWVADFSEGWEAEAAQQSALELLGSYRRAIPRLVVDERGEPQRRADGSLVTQGEIASEADAPFEYLRTVAAFLSRKYATSLISQSDEIDTM